MQESTLNRQTKQIINKVFLRINKYLRQDRRGNKDYLKNPLFVPLCSILIQFYYKDVCLNMH